MTTNTTTELLKLSKFLALDGRSISALTNPASQTLASQLSQLILPTQIGSARNFSAGNNALTCKYPGIYQIAVRVVINTAPNNQAFTVNLYKNGAVIESSTSSASQTPPLFDCQFDLFANQLLVVGDILTVAVFSSSSSTTVANKCFMTVTNMV